jgi:hypothetical protein
LATKVAPIITVQNLNGFEKLNDFQLYGYDGQKITMAALSITSTKR